MRSLALAAFLCCCAAPAPAQFFSRPADVTRPSINSPSGRLGLIGGYFTRDDVSRIRSFGTASESQTLDPMAKNGRFGFRRQGSGEPLPDAFTPFRPGFSRRLAGPEMIDFGALRHSSLLQATDFMTATDVSGPIGGWKLEHPGSLRDSILPPTPRSDPARTAFHDYFGLTPAQSVKPPAAEVESLATLVERENDAAIKSLTMRAIAAFKAATGAEEDGRGERLASANRQLQTLRDQDRSAALPVVLLMHTSLEKDQLLHALDCLFEFVSRDPFFLASHTDIRGYYGDPGRFDEQMRRYARLADETSTNAEPYLLAAYCARMANDTVRYDLAIAGAERTGRNDPRRDRIYAVIGALRAAR
ncbi:MAG: hypothetical protein U1D55_16725 [Phycisphaerae bacterium]